VTFGVRATDAVPLIIAALVAAAAISLLVTPIVRRWAIRWDVLDRPNARRVNPHPVPRGGGIAVALAFVLVATLLVALNHRYRVLPLPAALDAGELIALLAGGALAAVLGALDDYLDLRARWQFLFQLVLAVGAVLLGLGISFINNPFGAGLITFGQPFVAGFAMLWILGMINSMNFIDGLDGLSTGLAIIAALTLGLISLTRQIDQPFVAVLCFALAGSLLGFLRWNFHPASIFIGTSGVMFVGYTLAILSILGTAKVAVALLVLGVPIIDTFWIIVRRAAAGRSPFSPDRGHIHHRLLDLGLTHRQTVVLIYGMSGALAILSLVLTGASQVYAFAGVFVGIGAILFVLAWGGFSDSGLEAETYEANDRAEGPR
jgi:UDP-GlcNAc:undecaprenyl-phosphate/decaprenyl-phosphate GlcNAc-1-phosphate transferase